MDSNVVVTRDFKIFEKNCSLSDFKKKPGILNFLDKPKNLVVHTMLQLYAPGHDGSPVDFTQFFTIDAIGFT